MTTTQRPRTPRRPSQPPGPNPASRGLILVGVAVVLGLILLVKGGGIGFDSDKNNIAIGTGTATSTTTTVPPTTVPPTVAPSTVKVVSANATGGADPKMAGKTSDFLKQNGYTQVTAADALQPAQQTVVYFAPGFEANGKSVATLLGLAPTQVQALASGAKLVKAQPADAGLIVVAAMDIQPKVTPASGTTTTVAGATTTVKAGATGTATTTTVKAATAGAVTTTVPKTTTTKG